MIEYLIGSGATLGVLWVLWASLQIHKQRRAILGLTTAIELLATAEDDTEKSEPIGFHIT